MAPENKILTIEQEKILELVGQEQYFYYPFPLIENGMKYKNIMDREEWQSFFLEQTKLLKKDIIKS